MILTSLALGLFVGLLSPIVLAGESVSVSIDLTVESTERYSVDWPYGALRLTQSAPHCESLVYVVNSRSNGGAQEGEANSTEGLMTGRTGDANRSSMEVLFHEGRDILKRRDVLEEEAAWTLVGLPVDVDGSANELTVQKEVWLRYVSEYLAPASMAQVMKGLGLEDILNSEWHWSLVLTGGSGLACKRTEENVMVCQFEYSVSLGLP